MFLLTFPPVVAAQNFAPAVTYDTGDGPASVAAADVNADGAVDLITANASAATLSVFTNDGSGVFGSNATYSVFPNPTSVAGMDSNGDGKVDLACACGGQLVVLTNNGSGGFASAGSTAGTLPFWVIARDMNEDGKTDLIGSSYNSLLVFTNAGDDSYELASSAGFGSQSATVADLDRDGRPDLIEAKSWTLLTLTNQGNGSFASASTNALESIWPGSIAAADVNGDGSVDVIVPDYGSGSGTNVTVLTNDGDGILVSMGTYPVADGPTSVIVPDVNGDGWPDLIAVGLFRVLSVSTNDGTGGFVRASTSNIGFNSRSVMAADLNADGKLDLVTANEVNDNFSVFLNVSTFASSAITPALTLKNHGEVVHVSWPSSSPGWSLQQSPNLDSTNWSPGGYRGYNMVDDGTNKTLVVPPTTSTMFFRLMHP